MASFSTCLVFVLIINNSCHCRLLPGQSAYAPYATGSNMKTLRDRRILAHSFFLEFDHLNISDSYTFAAKCT